MKQYFAFFLALLFQSCATQQHNRNAVVSNKYDCRLFSGEFDEKPYVLVKSIEPAFTIFKDSINDGTIFFRRYFNDSESQTAIVLDAKTGELWISDAGIINKSSFTGQDFFVAMELITKIEKGSFRQICSAGPSEGSLSLLLVKENGKIVSKYEASQYDYSHLNESEEEKIKNALGLIRLLDTKN